MNTTARVYLALPSALQAHRSLLGDLGVLVDEWSVLLAPLAGLRAEALAWAQSAWAEVEPIEVNAETIRLLREAAEMRPIVGAIRSYEASGEPSGYDHPTNHTLPVLLGLAALSDVRAAVAEHGRLAKGRLEEVGRREMTELLQPVPTHDYGAVAEQEISEAER